MNTRFRTADMTYVLGQSDAVAVILAERSGPMNYLAMMREVVPGLGARPDVGFPLPPSPVTLSDEPTRTRRLAQDAGRRPARERRCAPRAGPPVDPPRAAFVFYTSGTTGFPKGAVHDHRIVSNAWDMGDRMGVTVDDVILMYLPLFHAFGFICGALMSLTSGARRC